jgi:hypothetical protein
MIIGKEFVHHTVSKLMEQASKDIKGHASTPYPPLSPCPAGVGAIAAHHVLTTVRHLTKHGMVKIERVEQKLRPSGFRVG